MKIEIYKKENDDNIYHSYGDNKDIILDFENLKNISKLFLDKKLDDADISYEITCANDLDLYKNTLDDILNSILNDEDLINLYKEHKNDNEK